MKIQTRNKVCIVTEALFITAFIFGLFRTDLFAAWLDTQIKELGDLEKREQAAPIENIVRPKPEYKAEGLRNPFQSPFYEPVAEKPSKKQAAGVEAKEIEKPLPSLKVQGVIWGGSFPQAIINDKVVKVEDVIEGASIIGIGKDGIEVFFDKRKHKLAAPAGGAVSSKKP